MLLLALMIKDPQDICSKIKPNKKKGLRSLANVFTDDLEGGNGGSYSIFNFDDLPDYEPLDVTLRLLQNNETASQGLDKLLQVLNLSGDSQPNLILLIDRYR